MEKSGNQLGIQPVARINPVESIASISQIVQRQGSKQHALAQQASLLKNGLAQNVLSHTQVGVSSAELSPLAKYINQTLQQANTNRLPDATIQQLVTTNPTQTIQFSKALSLAISKTGLFYESHLADVVDGQRSLASLRLEPQMQSQQAAYHLLPQQLQALEHHRISWHGEVWPNQLMSWQIQLPEQAPEQQSRHEGTQSAQAITTTLSLDLPKLGKVNAEIRLVNGQVNLQLNAEEKETQAQLEQARLALLAAIQHRGQDVAAIQIQASRMETSHA